MDGDSDVKLFRNMGRLLFFPGFPVCVIRTGREVLQAAGPAVPVLGHRKFSVGKHPLVEFIVAVEPDLGDIRGCDREKGKHFTGRVCWIK